MKLNRKWIMVLALVMSMAMATTGTLAYLTDRDSEANVFTMGNVEIDLTEDFDQGAELLPGLDIEKKPVITNTGKTEAWAWMIVSIPTALDNWNQGGGQEGSNNNVIHWNITGATHEGYVTDASVEKAIAAGILPEGTTAADITANNQTWDVLNNGLEYQNAIDGVMYNHYVMLYNKALQPGETTLPIMHKVFLDEHVDIDPDGNLSKVDAGVVTPIDWNINDDGNPIIYVSAYAIQKEGFATVEEAYAAYNAQWTTEEGVNNGLEYGTPAKTVSDQAGLEAALENGGSAILTDDIEIDATNSSGYGKAGIVVADGASFNGNGNTYTVNKANSTWDCAIAAKNGTIENLTVSGAMRGIFMPGATGNVYIDNVTFDDVIYTFNSDAGSKEYGVYVTNSTLNGWTSFSDVHKEVVFTDCTFGEGNGYAFCRPYNAPSIFTNCVFEEGFEFDTSKSADITFNNCYYGDTLITAENAATLCKGETIFFYNGVGSVVFK